MQVQPKPITRLSSIAMVLCLLALTASAPAQDQLTRLGGGSASSMTVPLFKSRVVALNAPAARVSVGNPDVADILILQSTQLYVLGKDLGTTNVLLWDRGDNLIGTVNVEVTHDLQSLKEKFFRVLPNEKIEVYSAQRNIILAGRVSNVANMNAALQIAYGYFTQLSTATESETFELQSDRSGRADRSVGEVVNLMSVGGVQQVMLEVKVAEISREELRKLDVQFNTILQGSSRWNWGGVNGGASFPDATFEPGGVRLPVFNNDAPFGPVIDEFAPNDMIIGDKGFFASFLSSNALFNFAIDAAKENGLAKILAEPTLVTQTGHEARFLSGGEFPIPVPRGQNGVTIEFKEFGVGIGFLPVVLDKSRISLKLNISVSELASPNSVAVSSQGVSSTFVIPSLTKRSAEATVELADGQTLGLAGLISENMREVVTKFPGLGSIPGIGALFRSQEYQKGETELLILVTPHLAKPLVPAEVVLPTDGFEDPSDFGWYFMGSMKGR
ncbi:MAG TPA: type II and III secretion system protein family protein, partial [Gammaproteobacteria bacterium]